MKVSDLIKKLEIIKHTHGDNELSFTVEDSYSIYGAKMTTDLKCGEDCSTHWKDVYSNNGFTTISFSLSKTHEGKKPKITFRT